MVSTFGMRQRWGRSLLCILAAAALSWPLAMLWGQVPPPSPDRFFTDVVTCPPRGFVLDGTVDRVIDGDTVIVSTLVTYRIRLLDCWAPESRTLDIEEKKRGLQSKARMTELASGKPVRVFVPVASGDMSELITLGRVLGRVWLKDDNGTPAVRDLSSVMVSEGLATRTKAPPPEASP